MCRNMWGGDIFPTTLRSRSDHKVIYRMYQLVNLHISQIHAINVGKSTTHSTGIHCGLIFNVFVREDLEDKVILMQLLYTGNTWPPEKCSVLSGDTQLGLVRDYMVKTEGFISPVPLTFRIRELLSSKQRTGRSDGLVFIHAADWRCKEMKTRRAEVKNFCLGQLSQSAGM